MRASQLIHKNISTIVYRPTRPTIPFELVGLAKIPTFIVNPTIRIILNKVIVLSLEVKKRVRSFEIQSKQSS